MLTLTHFTTNVCLEWRGSVGWRSDKVMQFICMERVGVKDTSVLCIVHILPDSTNTPCLYHPQARTQRRSHGNLLHHQSLHPRDRFLSVFRDCKIESFEPALELEFLNLVGLTTSSVNRSPS